jgi:DNA-binding MarR family transcriptional regulator
MIRATVDRRRGAVPVPPSADPHEQAAALFALLPDFFRWTDARIARTGLTLRQFAALESIRAGVASPGEIAQRWDVTPATLTGIVDRLEKAGLVRRAPDPADGRRLRLELTAAGLAACDDVRRSINDEVAALLAAAPDEERAALDRALALMRRTLDALQANLEGDRPDAG